MFKITVTGSAETNFSGGLRHLDGIDGQECFSDYFRGVSAEDVLSGGYLKFKYENACLYSVVEYSSSRKLTLKELEELRDYTQGQWSDGIGENFEQQPQGEIDGEEVYISPWHSDQVVSIFQTGPE